MSYIPLIHFVDKSTPDMPKGRLVPDGLGSAMYNPLRSKPIFDQYIRIDQRPYDFDYRDFYPTCANENTMYRLAPGNWWLWRKDENGATIDSSNPRLTYNNSNNYFLAFDYANGARESGLASGYTRSGSFDIAGQYVDERKVYVGIAAVKIKEIRTSGADSYYETGQMGMSGWERVGVLFPNWYRLVPGVGSSHMVLRCYVYGQGWDWNTAHTVFGTAGVDESSDVITSTSLDTWMMIQVVHWPDGGNSKIQFRVLGQEFNNGTLGIPKESPIFTSTVSGYAGHTRPVTPIAPSLYLGYATHAILPASEIDAVNIGAIEWKLFDNEHVCKAYEISGNQLHFSVTNEVALELLVDGNWTDTNGIIGKRTYLSTGEYTLTTPDFTAIRPVLKNTGLMNAGAQGILNWIEASQETQRPTDVLTTFDDQLDAYLEYHGLPPFPEWWRMQLRRATASERIRMLRERGIYNLPYTSKIFGSEQIYQFDPTQTRISLTGNGLFGMEVSQVRKLTWSNYYTGYSITTTGATYVLTTEGMELWQLIDPTINEVNPRLVSKIRFGTTISNLTPQTLTRELVTISSSDLTFSFHSDSLVEIEALGSFSYIHTNLITGDWDKEYDGKRRFVTDGAGGWVYAEMNTDVSIVRALEDTTCTFSTGGKMAHMVFPPKLFDFEKLYGADSYPIWKTVYYENGSEDTGSVSYPPAHSALLHNTYFVGTIAFWNGIYRRDASPQDGYPDNDLTEYPQWTTEQCHRPYHLTSASGPFEGYWGYEIRDPEYVKGKIAALKAAGFKVITYFGGGQDEWCNQSIDDTLDWVRWWVNEFGWDGFYMDGPEYGMEFFSPYRGTWPDAYTFVKELRRIFGDDGILIFHSTVDPLCMYSGGRAPMILTYGDIQLVGETGTLAGACQFPTDSYLRYNVSDYGISNTMGSFTYFSALTASLPISEADRALTGNLHGTAHTYQYRTLDDYANLRTEYSGGTLPIDVTTLSWWHDISDLQFAFTSNTVVKITWTTSVAADSEVGWTSIHDTGGPYDYPFCWWEENGDIRNRNYNASLVTSHSMNITLSGVAVGETVKIRVRSQSASSDIWGAQLEILVNGYV